MINPLTMFLSDYKFEHGTKIPPERELIGKMNNYLSENFSRGDIKSQIKYLNDIGLIESKQGSGNYLSEKFTPAPISNIVEASVQLGYTKIDDVYDARQMFEYSILDCWLKVPEDDRKILIKQLEINLLEMGKLIKKSSTTKSNYEQELINIDFVFHENLNDIISNPLLNIIINSLSDVIKNVMNNNIKNFWKNASITDKQYLLQCHWDMITYLATYETEEYKKAVQAHYEFAKKISVNYPNNE